MPQTPECVNFRKYLKTCEDKLPDYWHGKSAHACIEGICAMIAREKYSDYAIADLYECPVTFIPLIRNAYTTLIDKYKEMHVEMLSEFGEHYTSDKPSDNDRGFLAVLTHILRGAYDEG